MKNWRNLLVVTAAACSLAACEEDLFVVYEEPDAPRDLAGYYYDRGVELSWTLGPGWDGEAFRVYGKRLQDRDYFFIAEVTSCAEDICYYRDTNVRPGVTYAYYVSAVDLDSGLETESDYSIEVQVLAPNPPPKPRGVAAVALDNAVYLYWPDDPAEAEGFSLYRLYESEEVDGVAEEFFLGSTDSPGFVDFLATNGETSTYFVTSVDVWGHESNYSEAVAATPRPDYTEEFVYAYQDVPAQSGFRFQETEDEQGVMSGTAPNRHFRLESDPFNLWLVPGPGVRVYPDGRVTTALKCGPGADVYCTSWEKAPTSGYTQERAAALLGVTYMFRVPGDDGGLHYGAVRISRSGADQNENELIVFDWAYQTQAGNPNLNPIGPSPGS